IPFLEEKIKTELAPQQAAAGAAPKGNSSEAEQGIALLTGWANAAGEKMSSASRHLDGRKPGLAEVDQQPAIDELERVWDAVIPFHPLLARDLADQTTISHSLAPEPPADSESAKDAPSAKADSTSGNLKSGSATGTPAGNVDSKASTAKPQSTKEAPSR